MHYLLVYDIDLNSSEQKKNKLNKVAKICENYGLRVQNSVFELNINTKDFILLKDKLSKVIDWDIDSIRIYELGKNCDNKLTILGKREIFESIKDNSFFV